MKAAWHPTKGEYVRILPQVECHPSLYRDVGRIVEVLDWTLVVEFNHPVLQMEGRNDNSNKPAENQYVFYPSEIEFDPFLSARQQVLQEEEQQ